MEENQNLEKAPIEKRTNRGRNIFLIILIFIVIAAIVIVILLNLKREIDEEISAGEQSEEDFENILITSDIFNVKTEDMENHLSTNPEDREKYEKLSENIKNCKNTHATFSVPNLSISSPLFENPSGELIVEKIEDGTCLVRQVMDFVLDCGYNDKELEFTYNNMETGFNKNRDSLFGPAYYLFNYIDIKSRVLTEIAKDKFKNSTGVGEGSITIKSWDKETELNLEEDLMAEEMNRKIINKSLFHKGDQ